MRNGDRGGGGDKKERRRLHCTWEWGNWILPRRHTNDQQGCMILTQNLWKQYSVFFMPHLSEEQKLQHPTTACVWYGPEWRLILHCDLRWKYEDTLISLREGWKTRWRRFAHSLDGGFRAVWQSQSPVLIFLLGFKGVFHVFFHTQFTVLASVQAANTLEGVCQLFNVYTVIEKTLTIFKGLCNTSVGVCNALYNWILHRAPHTWDWKWIMHYQWSHQLIVVNWSCLWNNTKADKFAKEWECGRV